MKETPKSFAKATGLFLARRFLSSLTSAVNSGQSKDTKRPSLVSLAPE